MKVLGITLVFNEADCVTNALNCLAGVADHVLAFDHGSTDGTADIIKGYGGPVILSNLSRRKVPYARAWHRISKCIREKSGFDWVVWLSADEVLRQPTGEWIDRQSLARLHNDGFRVIRPKGREFWITEKDGDQANCIERMRHFYYAKAGHSPRAWRHDLTGTMPYGLHRYDHQWGIPVRHISRDQWILDHYPVRSVEQGTRKIMRERKPRPKHRPYIKAKCKNLVRSAATLQRVE